MQALGKYGQKAGVEGHPIFSVRNYTKFKVTKKIVNSWEYNRLGYKCTSD